MDAKLLSKLFGDTSNWKGPCVVILDADATLETVGGDSLMTGGVKVYSPRLFSGRIAADALCYMADHNILVILQQVKQRTQTGEEKIKQTLYTVDCKHVAALEFSDLNVLAQLGLPTPTVRPGVGFQPIG